MRRSRTPYAPELGFSLTDAAISFGGNAIVPGSGPVIAAVTGSGLLDQFFGGGAATDRKRLERVEWTLALARRGSVTAAKVILEAPNNVGGNERPMWEKARTMIPPDVLQAAYEDPAQVWITGMPEFYNNPSSSLYQRMTSEAANANQGAIPSIVERGTQFVQTLFGGDDAGASSPAPAGQVVYGPDGRPVGYAPAQSSGPPWGLILAGAGLLLLAPRIFKGSRR